VSNTFSFADGNEEEDSSKPSWFLRCKNSKSVGPVSFRESREVKAKP